MNTLPASRSLCRVCLLASLTLLYPLPTPAQVPKIASTVTQGIDVYNGWLANGSWGAITLPWTDWWYGNEVGGWIGTFSATVYYGQQCQSTDTFREVITVENANSPVYLLLEASSEWYVGLPDGVSESASTFSGHCDDGYHDAPVNVAPSQGVFYGADYASSGKHLVQVKPTNGKAVYTSPWLYSQATLTENDAPLVSPGMYMTSNYIYPQIDTNHRGLDLVCSLGATAHRSVKNGVPQIVPNTPDSDGTLQIDTLAPSVSGNPLNVTYTPVVHGTWGNDSSYLWHETLLGQTDSGSFWPDAVPPFTQRYSCKPGLTEHVYLHLKDGSDQADATQNAWLHLHGKYEDWRMTSKTTWPSPNRPLNLHDWEFILSRSTGNASHNFKVTLTLTKQWTETASIENTLVTQLTDSIGYAQFQTKQNITAQQQFTVAYSESIEFSLPPWTKRSYYLAPVGYEEEGMTSLWNTQGYVRDENWDGTLISGANGVAQGQITFDDEPVHH
jgi:hypothetical protein